MDGGREGEEVGRGGWQEVEAGKQGRQGGRDGVVS